MFMVTLRLKQPPDSAPISRDMIKAMIAGCAVPEDKMEHVYVQTAPVGRVEAVVFIATADLAPALVNSAVLTSRLMQGSLSGWLLLGVCVESAV
jgi:hypothetical protein